MVAIKIIEWEDKYAEQFKRLSLEWLEKYVSVEQADLEKIGRASCRERVFQPV